MRSSLALIVVVACGSSSSAPDASAPAPPPGPPAHHAVAHPPSAHGYAMDDVLRMNHVQVKATHNSYHVETPGNTEPTWHYSQRPLAEQATALGVREFELDIRWVAETARFEVYHLPLLDEGTVCRVFTECLLALRQWSDANPGAAPLVIQIEPKDLPDSDDPERTFTALHDEILRVWPRERIITPDDVQGDAPTVHDGLRAHGWPTLAEARGTVTFTIDNTAEWRDAYTYKLTSLAGRLFFVTTDPAGPLAGLILMNDPTDVGIAAAVKDGLMVRTFADSAGAQEQRAVALASGAHILSSDFPDQLTIPDGDPARCNPLIAPPGCTPAAIEDPSRLR